MSSGFRHYGKPEQFKICCIARTTVSTSRREGHLQGNINNNTEHNILRFLNFKII